MTSSAVQLPPTIFAVISVALDAVISTSLAVKKPEVATKSSTFVVDGGGSNSFGISHSEGILPFTSAFLAAAISVQLGLWPSDTGTFSDTMAMSADHGFSASIEAILLIITTEFKDVGKVVE